MGNEIVFRMSGVALAKRPQRLVLEESQTMQIMSEPERHAIVFLAKHRVVQIQPCGRRNGCHARLLPQANVILPLAETSSFRFLP